MGNDIITDRMLLGPSARTVACASGRKKGDQRWTELVIYSLDPPVVVPPATLHFVAEIVGESLVDGEVRRVRRMGFTSIRAALDWGAFDQRSALYQQLRRAAIDWLESCGTSHPVTSGERAEQAIRSLFPGRCGMNFTLGDMVTAYLAGAGGEQ